MNAPLLTPAEVLAHFRRKDRHWPRRAAARGLIEAVNVGSSGNGARYLYRLKNLEAEAPAVNQEEAHYLELKGRHGWRKSELNLYFLVFINFSCTL